MDAFAFWEKFKVHINKNTELIGLWSDSGKFTDKIIEKLRYDVIAEEGVITEKEYFRIDLISYRDNKKDSADKYLHKHLYKYTWDLVTAVEHENESANWMDEVIKLAYIACPLRVVIGYWPKKQKEEQQECLDKIAKELNGIQAWETTSLCGEFMIILGDSALGRDVSGRCVYTPYIYDPESQRFELFE